MGRTVCTLRFIALFAFYSEFCVRAFDEGNAGDWQYTAPAGLIGDYPLVDAFSLGQLAERRDMFVDNGPTRIGGVQGEVIAPLAKEEYRQVLNALQDRWGKRELFAALCMSLESKAILYPPGDDLRNQVVSANRATGIQRAREWYDAGAGMTAARRSGSTTRCSYVRATDSRLPCGSAAGMRETGTEECGKHVRSAA